MLKKFNFFAFLDECVEQEQKQFLKTLHEEVFARKIGQNPMLVVRPEEIPVIAKIIEDEVQQANIKSHQYNHEVKDTPKKHDNDNVDDCSDNEIAPENYFFTT